MVFYIVSALILIYFILIYNSLVSVKNNVEKAWANIDVLLKQPMTNCPN
jgi:LemA protein